MKLYDKLYGALLLVACLSAVGCAAGDPEVVTETESIGETSLAIQPEDRNRCCFPQIETPAACEALEGVFELESGLCTIFVEQRCELVTAPSGETGCCCKVKVLDTMAGCNNKDWDDFYDKCQQ